MLYFLSNTNLEPSPRLCAKVVTRFIDHITPPKPLRNQCSPWKGSLENGDGIGSISNTLQGFLCLFPVSSLTQSVSSTPPSAHQHWKFVHVTIGCVTRSFQKVSQGLPSQQNNLHLLPARAKASLREQ